MKRKIFLALMLLMVSMITMFATTGCAEEEEALSATEVTPLTITIYGVTDDATTEEAIAAVQEAMSNYTKSQYTTNVVLKLFKESEYEAEVAKVLAAQAEAAANKGSSSKENSADSTTAETEVVVDELGLKVTVYPEVSDNQIDIFLVRSYEDLVTYNEKGYLSNLNSTLTTKVAKKLDDYISPVLMSNMKLTGKTVAIPNNHTVGEYQYILLNKEFVDKYYYDYEELQTIYNIETFVYDMQQTEPDCIPLLNIPDPWIEYISLDGSNTLFGGYCSNQILSDPKTTPKFLLDTWQYRDYVALINQYYRDGIITEGNLDTCEKKVAVTVLSGDSSLPEKYEDEYYVLTYRNPIARTEDVYSSMFCVSANTKNLDRSMEIVTLLNTDPYIKNLFQYGVLNVNYELDDNGQVVYLKEDYKMNNLYTGNMFISYTEAGTDPDIWEKGKVQNRDLKTSPYLGLNVYDEAYEAGLVKASELFDEYYKKSIYYDGSEDAYDYMDALLEELEEIPELNALMDKTDANSLVNTYGSWYNGKAK